MKPEKYMHETFGINQDERLVADFSCFYDASLVSPAHMYITEKHICFHIHGTKVFEKILWTDVVDVVKKNTAKIIPNAIVIATKDNREHFFAFMNRHAALKLILQKWRGREHKDSQNEESEEWNSANSKKSSVFNDVPENVLNPITEVSITDVYNIKKELGTGAFSVVQLAVHKKSKVERAVKVIDKEKVGKEKKEMLDREVAILKSIQHPGIVSVVEIYETPRYLYLVMELATGGELFDAIVKRGMYSEKDAAAIVRQIAEACAYLHSKGIVHRDLKPENLLLSDKTPQARVKIADFGLSKVMETSTVLQTACGTPGYVAPEVLMGEGYNQEVDVWSIGVIMYILLCGFPPFYAENNHKLFEKIMKGQYGFPSPYWDRISPAAKNLIKHLLVVQPKNRYTTAQILNDPWILGHTANHEPLQGFQEALQKTRSSSQVTVMQSTSSAARLALGSVDNA